MNIYQADGTEAGKISFYSWNDTKGKKKTGVGQTCEQQLMLRDEVTASFPFMTIRELAAAASAAVNE